MSGRAPIFDGLRLVRGHARSYPAPFWSAVAGSVVYAAGSVGAAVALGWATDEVLVPLYEGGTAREWGAVALIMGVTVLRSSGVAVRRYYAGMTAARARAGLQRDLARRMVLMPIDRVRSRPPGQLLAHLDADTEAAVDVIHPTPFTIGVLSMLVFAVIGLALLDLPLMLATLGVLPIVLATSWASATLLEQPTELERSANASVTAAASEIIAGTQVIKTLGREDAELDRYAGIVDGHRQRRVRLQSLHIAIDGMFALAPQVAMILIVVVGTQRVDAGALEPGGLVEAVALFGILAFPMQVIGFFLTDMPVSVVGHRRVDTVRAEPDDPLRTSTGTAMLPPGPLGATLSGVKVGSDDRLRLDDLDLEIRPGETLAIVGSTASGKSTVLEVLARLRAADSGSVKIGGVSAGSIADEELRTRVTLASQQAVLYTGTIRDNTDFGRTRDVEELEAALRIAGAADLENDLPDGFDTVVGEQGVTLSGGQRQRVALARALAGRPGLILLDDATAAVDPSLEETILESLAELPTTVVMVTHRVAAMGAADRVALMVGGRVKAIGVHEELLANPSYRRLVEAYRAEEVTG